nr:hypothetical protein [Tanacetum cinerariifolium]
MVDQYIQKKEEEKQIEEEQAAKDRYRKISACCDDDDNYNFAITPNEPVDSLIMGDEHLNTILATKSDELIKSSVENLVPNPSESKGENVCDVPACFTTFSNILFDADYDFYSVNDQSLSDEDIPKKIYSNPLFDEEIIYMKIDPHHFNAESNLIKFLLNHDSSIISSSSNIISLFDEFAGELTLLKSILPGISETDCNPENEIRLTKRLLYDNLSPRPLEDFVSENSNAEIESFSPSPIPLEDLTKLVSHVQLSFKDLDSPEDDPVIVVNDTDEDDESQKHKLELKKNKAKAKAALLKAQPSFPNIRQLNELLVKSLQTEFLKILFTHDFSSSLPTKLKELTSKFNEPTKEVKGLKKQVHNLKIKMPGELKEIPTKLEDFTKTVTSLASSVVKLKTLKWELPVEFLSVSTQVEVIQVVETRRGRGK